MGHQRIIGHRGARDLWPENSREGFLKVQALPIHGVEFDVHPTADGKLAVIHDPTLERTTEGSGAVAARTAAELAATRLRGSDEGVPMLDEVLAILNPSGLELHVELKAGADGTPYSGLEAQVAGAMTQAGLAARTVLTSFWLPVLAELRRAAPGMRLLASLDPSSVERQGGLDAMLDELDRLRVDLVAVRQDLLAERWDLFTARVPADRLGVWVVNRPEDVARWRSMPVGQVTTDRPDLFVGAAP